MPSTDRLDPRPLRVVIVGGGIAALEAVLALRDLAATRVRVTLIAPEPEFAPGPPHGARAIAREHAAGLDLGQFMREHGGCFRRTVMLSADVEEHTVRCATGLDEPYDVLIVAVGASARPAFQHALTVGADYPALDVLLADLEQGQSRGIAFIVPEGCTWPVPLYELALLAADQVRRSPGQDTHLCLITPEPTPLKMLGPDAGAAVTRLLRAARIKLYCGVTATVHRGGYVDIGSPAALDVERVVALPRLGGPRVDGLPSDARGFIPVDDHGRVIGAHDAYAAGDATNHSIKQGGLAGRQADAVAEHIAMVAGAPVDAAPYMPEVRGRLLAAPHVLWSPSTEGLGRRLSSYLETNGVVESPPRGEADGMDVVIAVA